LIAVLQRVASGTVSVEDRIIGKIDQGLVILLGVMEDDNEKDSRYLSDKISVLRIFNDEQQKMNRSLSDVNGSALVVSQFTLCADTRKGRRPSFIRAANPEKGKALYKMFIAQLQSNGIPVESGTFGAMMKVSIENDGPVTIILDSQP